MGEPMEAKFETIDRPDGSCEVAIVGNDGSRKVLREGTRAEIAAFRDGYTVALMIFGGMIAMMTPESGWAP